MNWGDLSNGDQLVSFTFLLWHFSCTVNSIIETSIKSTWNWLCKSFYAAEDSRLNQSKKLLMTLSLPNRPEFFQSVRKSLSKNIGFKHPSPQEPCYFEVEVTSWLLSPFSASNRRQKYTSWIITILTHAPSLDKTLCNFSMFR